MADRVTAVLVDKAGRVFAEVKGARTFDGVRAEMRKVSLAFPDHLGLRIRLETDVGRWWKSRKVRGGA